MPDVRQKLSKNWYLIENQPNLTKIFSQKRITYRTNEHTPSKTCLLKQNLIKKKNKIWE